MTCNCQRCTMYQGMSIPCRALAAYVTHSSPSLTLDGAAIVRVPSQRLLAGHTLLEWPPSADGGRNDERGRAPSLTLGCSTVSFTSPGLTWPQRSSCVPLFSPKGQEGQNAFSGTTEGELPPKEGPSFYHFRYLCIVLSTAHWLLQQKKPNADVRRTMLSVMPTATFNLRNSYPKFAKS